MKKRIQIDADNFCNQKQEGVLAAKDICRDISISENKTIPHLPIDGHQEYLEFHRNNILKK